MVPTTDNDEVLARAIAPYLKRGSRVMIADGAGSPVGLGRALAEAARRVGGVRLVVGWSFELPEPLDPSAFPDVRVLVGGYALRQELRRPHVHYLPVRLSAVPSLLHTALRPDILIAGLTLVPGGGLGFGTEVAWMRSAIDAGAHVLAEVNHGLPVAAREAALPAEAVTVISDVERPALTIPIASPSPAAEQIGRQVASLIPPGATVQYGPGIIGDAVIRALQVPVRVQSGVVSDAVMDLDRRGLLLGSPLTAYVIGTPELFEWADGRPMADRVERTHDITSLSQQAFFAINTALEIDWSGQVNVEGFRGDTVAGVGGHPDFAAAAAIAKRGASIVAVSRTRGRHRTLVEHLSAPASTARSDVDIVVTERGIADLRGLDDTERRRLLLHTWGDADDEVGRNS